MLPTPEDHVAICDLYARDCLALDRGDVDAWIALFARDAWARVGRARGATPHGDSGARQLAPWRVAAGRSTSGNSALVARNLLFVPGDGNATRNAVYEDELLPTPSGWRIARCRCRFVTSSGLSERPER